MFSLSIKSSALFLVLALTIQSCSEQPSNNETPQKVTPTQATTRKVSNIAEIVKDYETLIKINTKPIPVTPGVSLLCISDPAAQVIKTHGPHTDKMLNIFMNPSAKLAYHKIIKNLEKKIKYPVGAIILKEKISTYSEDKDKPNSLGGLIKREPGYDSENGDWEYFYRDEDEKLTTGKIQNCIDCHKTQKDTDYIYGVWTSGHTFSKNKKADINPYDYDGTQK